MRSDSNRYDGYGYGDWFDYTYGIPVDQDMTYSIRGARVVEQRPTPVVEWHPAGRRDGEEYGNMCFFIHDWPDGIGGIAASQMNGKRA